MSAPDPQDLTGISFGEQALRLLENYPSEWANAIKQGKPHILMHKGIGCFRVHWFGYVHHCGLSIRRVASLIEEDEKDTKKLRFHVRKMTLAEGWRMFMAYRRWRKRAFDMNHVPLAEGDTLFGP